MTQYRRTSEGPIFIQGCHRSGTTLLRRLLDVHPRLACGPESKFLAGLHAFVTYPQVGQALASLGQHRRDQLSLVRAVTATVMDGYTAGRGKVRWVDKTPNYYRIIDFIDDVFEQQALFVVLARHPLDVVESLYESPYFRPGAIEDPEAASVVARYGHSRSAWALYWREVYTALGAFAVSWPRRVCVVHYETLVTRPVETVNRVLSFVGEATLACDVVEGALTHKDAAGYGDWKIRCTDSIHRQSVGRWVTTAAGDEIAVWRAVASLAESVGYVLDDPFPTRACGPHDGGGPQNEC